MCKRHDNHTYGPCNAQNMANTADDLCNVHSWIKNYQTVGQYKLVDESYTTKQTVTDDFNVPISSGDRQYTKNSINKCIEMVVNNGLKCTKHT